MVERTIESWWGGRGGEFVLWKEEREREEAERLGGDCTALTPDVNPQDAQRARGFTESVKSCAESQKCIKRMRS
jgi:hypothetical protein